MAMITALLAAILGVRVYFRHRSRTSGPVTCDLQDWIVPAPLRQASTVRLAVPKRDRLMLAHEMKNYLCAIKGNARLLRLGAKGQDMGPIIDRIDQAIERLEGFTWKEPACPDVTQARTRETVDVLQVAQACLRLNAVPGRMEFLLDASEGLPPIQGDPQRLEQVFMNLYGNALEAGADRVLTRFRRIGNELEITIEDNGRGCRPEVAARIFDPFFSTKPVFGPGGDTPEKGPMRGLGLFIVRSIVENHGGRIRATPKNGRGYGETGLVVYLHFPVSVPAAGGKTALPPLRPDRLPVAAGA